MTRTDADVLRAFAIAIVVSAGLLVLAFAGYIAATTAHTFATDGGGTATATWPSTPSRASPSSPRALPAVPSLIPPCGKAFSYSSRAWPLGPCFFSSFFHRPTKGVLPLWPLSSPPS